MRKLLLLTTLLMLAVSSSAYASVSVSALGDSISDTHFMPYAWPAVANIQPEGVAGNGVAEVLKRMEPDGIHGGWDWTGIRPYTRYTVVMLGINNIWPTDGPGATFIEHGLTAIYARLHQHHSIAIPVAMLPFGGCSCFTTARNLIRLQVNAWIAKQPHAINLYKVIGDGNRMIPADAASDGLHPSPEGAQLIARAIMKHVLTVVAHSHKSAPSARAHHAG